MIITQKQIKKLQKLLSPVSNFWDPDERRPERKRSPQYRKKGPGRCHAGSPQKKVRTYVKHYNRNHKAGDNA